MVKIEWLSPTHSLDVGELLHELLCGSMLVFDESCCLMLVSDFAGKLVERISGPTLWNLREALLYLDAVLLALRHVPLLQHRQSKCHGCCVEVPHPPQSDGQTCNDVLGIHSPSVVAKPLFSSNCMRDRRCVTRCADFGPRPRPAEPPIAIAFASPVLRFNRLPPEN